MAVEDEEQQPWPWEQITGLRMIILPLLLDVFQDVRTCQNPGDSVPGWSKQWEKQVA